MFSNFFSLLSTLDDVRYIGNNDLVNDKGIIKKKNEFKTALDVKPF